MANLLSAAYSRFFIRTMLTKAQKEEVLKKSKELLDKSKSLILVDFSKTSAQDMRVFRQALKDKASRLQVLKKRLLKIILKDKGIEFESEKIKAPVGAIYVPGGIEDAASEVYNFSKGREGFKILGGFDLVGNSFIENTTVTEIGQLPSRDVLLAQLLGMLTSPMRKLLFIMNEKAKQAHEGASQEKPAAKEDSPKEIDSPPDTNEAPPVEAKGQSKENDEDQATSEADGDKPGADDNGKKVGEVQKDT